MNVIYQFVVTNDIYPLPKSFWEISLEHDITINEIKISQEYEDIVKIKQDNEKYVHTFTNDSEHYTKEYPYRLIVKVIDGKNNKIYHWSLNEFLNRLNQMKYIYESNILNNKIIYDPYDNMVDPFRENSKSPFMLIGYSKCILSCLLYSKYDINYTFKLPIVEWQTGKRKGYLTVKFLSIYDPSEDEYMTTENENENENDHDNDSYLSSSTTNDNEMNNDQSIIEEKKKNNEDDEENDDDNDDDDDNNNNNNVDNDNNIQDNLLAKNKVKVGTELYFDIVIEKIEGITEDEFTQVHCQFNTNDFDKKLSIDRKKSNKKSNKEKKSKNSKDNEEYRQQDDGESLFSTNIKAGFRNNNIIFRYSQTIHLHITRNILRNLKHGYITFEIFGSKPRGSISSLINDLYTKENNNMNEFRAIEEQILDISSFNYNNNNNNNNNNNKNKQNINNYNDEENSNNIIGNHNNGSYINSNNENEKEGNEDSSIDIKEFNDNEIYTIPEDENIIASQVISDDDPSTYTDLSESHSQSQSQNVLSNKDDNNEGGTLKRLRNRLSSFSLSLSNNKSKPKPMENFNNESDIPTITRKSTINKKANKTLKRLSSISDSLNCSIQNDRNTEVGLNSINIYHHNVIINIKICELSSNGTYEPVNVQYLSSDDLGAFLIHQGLQRRIEVEVMHNSGDSLPIKYIKSFTLSNIRKTNIKKKNSNNDYDSIYENDQCKPMTLMPLVDQTKEVFSNGKQSVTSKYSWDSSLHESLFLNKETEKDSKILIKVEFDIGFEGQQTPSGISVQTVDHRSDEDKLNDTFKNLRINKSCKVVMNIALIIQNRQESQNIFTSFFTKSNMLTNYYNETFNLVLHKDENGQKNCLFHLPKEEIYIRGEECLGKLKFYNAEDLIIFSINMMKRRRNRQLAEYSRQYLYLNEIISKNNSDKEGINSRDLSIFHRSLNSRTRANLIVSSTSISNSSSNSINKPPSRSDEKLLISVIYLWKNYTIFKNRVIKPYFYLDSSSKDESIEKGEQLVYYNPEFSKVKSSIISQKKGHLYHPDLGTDPEKEPWIKSYVVIQKPYLYIYKHKNCIELVDVINLLDAKVSYNTEYMKSFNKENIFEVYTQYHNIYLQASNKKDMIQWINIIDPLGVGAAMSNIHQQK